MENKEEFINMNERVRITARISRKTRALAKGIYPVMGVSLEERIEFLLARGNPPVKPAS